MHLMSSTWNNEIMLMLCITDVVKSTMKLLVSFLIQLSVFQSIHQPKISAVKMLSMGNKLRDVFEG